MVARHAILSWYFHVITASIHGIVVVEEEEAQRVGVEKVPIIVSPFPFLEEHVSIQSETATLLTVKEKIFFSQKRY